MKTSELIERLQSAMEKAGDIECFIDIVVNDGTMTQTSVIDDVRLYGRVMDSEGHIDGGTIGIATKMNVLGSISTRNFVAKQFNDAFEALMNK